MKTVFLTLLNCFGFCCAQTQLTCFELSKDKNYTATYHEVIAYYKKLNQLYPQQQLTLIYRNSPYYELTNKRYPVGRIMTNTKLDFK